MKCCGYCVFLNTKDTQNCNFVCSINKLKHPYEPGLYLKNPREEGCEHFKEREAEKK